MHCVQTVELGAVGDPQRGHFMSITAGDTECQYTSSSLCQWEACWPAALPSQCLLWVVDFFYRETPCVRVVLTRFWSRRYVTAASKSAPKNHPQAATRW